MKMNNTDTDVKGIVKLNFVMATFDAMKYNYFSDNYEKAEKILGEAIDVRLSLMSDDDIQTFALAIIDGEEIGYDMENEDFYLRGVVNNYLID